MFCFGTQRSFSSCKACGPWANVHASKTCIKLCFTYSGKDTVAALSSEWVTRYESNATRSLSASVSASLAPLSHFWHDNTSIQLGGLIMFHACAPALTAVLFHFTPLWYVFVSSIMTGRKWLSTSGGGLSRRRDASWRGSTPRSCVRAQSSYRTHRVLFPRAVSGLPSALTDAQQYGTKASCCTCCTAGQKRDHGIIAVLWNGPTWTFVLWNRGNGDGSSS